MNISSDGKILVTGKTYPWRRQLRENGGKWCSASSGWTFEQEAGSNLESLLARIGSGGEAEDAPASREGNTAHPRTRVPLLHPPTARPEIEKRLDRIEKRQVEIISLLKQFLESVDGSEAPGGESEDEICTSSRKRLLVAES